MQIAELNDFFLVLISNVISSTATDVFSLRISANIFSIVTKGVFFSPYPCSFFAFSIVLLFLLLLHHPFSSPPLPPPSPCRKYDNEYHVDKLLSLHIFWRKNIFPSIVILPELVIKLMISSPEGAVGRKLHISYARMAVAKQWAKSWLFNDYREIYMPVKNNETESSMETRFFRKKPFWTQGIFFSIHVSGLWKHRSCGRRLVLSDLLG